MLRMLPPESLKAAARNARSTSSARHTGSGGGGPTAGVGRPPRATAKSTITSSRRRNASSRFARRLVVRIGEPVEPLHALEQVGDLDVRIPIACVLDLGPLAEDRVRLVEQEDAVDAVGLVEDAVEVLLRLADVLVDDRGEVDDVEIEAEIGGDDLGRQRLAGPRVAGEQCGHAGPARRVRHPSPTPGLAPGSGPGWSARAVARASPRAGRSPPSVRARRRGERAARGHPHSARGLPHEGPPSRRAGPRLRRAGVPRPRRDGPGPGQGGSRR